MNLVEVETLDDLDDELIDILRNAIKYANHQLAAHDNTLMEEVEELCVRVIKVMAVRADSGEDIRKCFECGATCPLFKSLDHIGPCISKEAQALLDKIRIIKQERKQDG